MHPEAGVAEGIRELISQTLLVKVESSDTDLLQEGVLDSMQHRLDQRPDAMRVRRRTVEHSFGTLKAWMGATHFLTRTLKRVSTEMSLHVLAYNMKRVIAILGVGPLMVAIRA